VLLGANSSGSAAADCGSAGVAVGGYLEIFSQNIATSTFGF